MKRDILKAPLCPHVSGRRYGVGEHGIVLISTLIFLLIITMFTVFSVRQVTLQERAVGNLMDRQNAFQASDLAVREGTTMAADNSQNEELALFAANCNIGGAAAVQGLCLPQANSYWKTYGWADTASRETVNTSDKYAVKPRFYIEYLGANKLMPGQELNVKAGFKMFKAVGRGVGLTTDSFVLTEKIIAVPPPSGS